MALNFAFHTLVFFRQQVEQVVKKHPKIALLYKHKELSAITYICQMY